MCVGPGTFLWKGTDELPVSLTLLRMKLLLTQLENPQKEEQANSYRAPTSCQHRIYICLLFTTTCSANYFWSEETETQG